MKSRSGQRYKKRLRSRSRSRKQRLGSKHRSRKQRLRSKPRSRKQRLGSKPRSRKQRLRSKPRSRKQKLRSKSRVHKKPKSLSKLIFNINEPRKKVDNKPIFDFKIIEMEGCGYCRDAKNLILSKKYTLDVKKEMNLEEKNQVDDYPYFPKIFKWDKLEQKYDFIGGYDKLQELLKR